MKPKKTIPALILSSINTDWDAYHLGRGATGHAKWGGDPLGFLREVLKFEPWSKQEDIARAILNHPRVAVQACTQSGKTAVAGALVLWYLFCHSKARVLTTATTARQVRKLLWSEIRRHYLRADPPLGGRLLELEIKIADGWDAIGFATTAGAQGTSSRFQGLHSETGHVLIVFDEAQGIGDDIWEAAFSMVGGVDTRFLVLGNPLGVGTQYQRVCLADGWETIKISAFDIPNFIEGAKRIEGLATPESVAGIERESGGKESPSYVARVLGEFPGASLQSLIRAEWLDASAARWERMEVILRDHHAPWPVVIGVDVARQGDDDTCFVPIYAGKQAGLPIQIHGHDAMSVCGRVIAMVKECAMWCSDVTVVIDETGGYGAGVLDRLLEVKRETGLGVVVQGVNFAERSNDPDRWANARNEMWFSLADALRDGFLNLPAKKYDADLVEIRASKWDSRGRLNLEPKEDFKARLGKSPDRGDALALAWHLAKRQPVMAPSKPEPRGIAAWT